MSNPESPETTILLDLFAFFGFLVAAGLALCAPRVKRPNKGADE
jgi:LPS O-antigen subunit length determinant protein (WzzB/FepE family)